MFIRHWWHPCQKNLWSWRLSIRNTSASWRGSDCEETVDPVSTAYGSPWFSSLDSWMGPLRADSWELFHIEIHQTPTNSPVNAYNFIRQSDKVSLKPTTHATEKKTTSRVSLHWWNEAQHSIPAFSNEGPQSPTFDAWAKQFTSTFSCGQSRVSTEEFPLVHWIMIVLKMSKNYDFMSRHFYWWKYQWEQNQLGL